MSVRLTLLSIFEIAGFTVTLIYFLFRITTGLERIGGLGTSYLARVRFGVRAIEKETSYLGPELSRLNEGLVRLSDQLGVIDRHLEAVARTLPQRKEGRP